MMQSKFSARCKGILLALVVPWASHANVLQGDRYFDQLNYKQARLEYLKSAEIGSPDAYYQLGLLNIKALGQKQDIKQAILWFSLAAESDFSDAKEIVEQIYQQLSQESVVQLKNMVQAIMQQYGKAKIEQLYFPEILTDKLEQVIAFSGEEEKGELNHDIGDEDFSEPDFDTAEFETGFEEDENSGFSDDLFSFSKKLKKRAKMAIVDYEIAPDGTLRNINPLHKIGRTKTILERLSSQRLTPPLFEGEPVYFTQRAYFGMATLDKFSFKEKHPGFYQTLRRMASRNQKSPKLEDQYRYAMLLFHFPWLAKQEGEAEKALKNTAEGGHAGAQYEYGLNLYREQKNIPEAVQWFSKSAKRGLKDAEYFLGDLMLRSPWIKHDEKKALYWFELAAQQGFYPALIRAAELRLTIEDEASRNLNTAINYLDKAQKASRYNPEYFYLRALSFRHKDNRNLKQAFSNMRRAIQLADSHNWDSSEWSDMLEHWMTGQIRVIDLDEES